MNGQAGLKLNGSEALRFFERSANASDPFPMSLHALGNHYYYGDERQVGQERGGGGDGGGGHSQSS